MILSVFSDLVWTYPDSSLSGVIEANLDIAHNGHVGFQVLGECINKDTMVSAKIVWEGGTGPSAEIFEMISIGVNENAEPKLFTTLDYSICKDYVTRQAPFRVYDALKPISEPYPSHLNRERLALYIRLYAPVSLPSGTYKGTLHIFINQQESIIPVYCKLWDAEIPKPSDSLFGILNTLNFDNISVQHHVPVNSKEYWVLCQKYIRMQKQLRCTHLTLPTGTPVRDENGEICDFDFSLPERVGQIAREEGIPFICGGFLAHWHAWDEPEYYLIWDNQTEATTLKGYLQLKYYLTKWAGIVKANHWEDCICQQLADEPNEPNAATYRILAGIFRKFLPNVPIIDAVETTNLGGAIDVWVPKQETFEKHLQEYQNLKNAGENMWFYTCGYPSGNIMNRIMDLPLSVSRTMLWMGVKYGLTGFLHYGFNFYTGDNIWDKACCPHQGHKLPAGDAHITYPGENTVWPSMRLEAQRNGAEDAALLLSLRDKHPAYIDTLLDGISTDFRNYSTDEAKIAETRIKMLADIFKYSTI